MDCPNCSSANPDTAKFCANCGTRLSPARSVQGERKLVTVLFADVVGSTAMGERIDPEEITEIMNGAFAFMNTAVAKRQGTVSRLMGDAILAFFGTPVARENDAERAIRAGLEIRESARQYAEQVRHRFGVEFQVRVGINTGLAVLDFVGDQVRTEFTAMGDTVNVANRLQSAASPGSILISHDTYRHVRGLFVLQPLETIQVKGKSEPLQVYQVQGERERAFRQPTRGVAGIETTMVGREAELALLKTNLNALQEAGERRARVINVIGDAGVGKSRLLYEFSNWLDLQPDAPRVFRSRATEEMSHLPYSLLRDLFAAEFKIYDNDSEAVAKEKLERGLMEVGGPDQDAWAPFIGHIIGFRYTHSPHLHGILDDAQQIRSLSFYNAAQFFKTVMQRQPALILLEDIHWADEGSLDFFEHLIQDCLADPLVLVCLARDTLFERRPSWGQGPAVHARVNLSPLSNQDSRQLVAEILRHVTEVPASLYELIVSQAEGNPFYVEEVIKMLIDDGVIIPGLESWQVRNERIVAGKIPPTLIGVLQARMDGLPSQERKVLHRASVAGRVFWDDLVAHMVNASETGEDSEGIAIDTTLSNLQARELIFHRDPSTFSGTTEYIFRHSLLRDVTYERLLKRLRRGYHLQVALWLCDHSADRAEEYAGRVGEHFERAGELPQAAEWYARAGKHAQDTYAPELAIDYYQRALSLWEQASEGVGQSHLDRIEVIYGLGHVLNWLGRYAEAVEAFQRMVGEAEAQGNAVLQARAWYGIAVAQTHQGETRAAIESARRQETLARSAEADLELSKALWIQAWGALRLGETETAFSLAEQVSQLNQQLQDRDQIAHSLNLLGILHSMSGRFPDAAHHFEQALAMFRVLGNRRRAVPLLNNLGVIAEARGDYLEAQRRYQEALDKAREIGYRDGEMVYLSNLGGIKARLGAYPQAEADLRQVIHMAGSSGLDVLTSTYSSLAEACLGQNRVDEALTAAQHALRLAEEMESQGDLGTAWRVLGQVAAYMDAPVPIELREGGQPRSAGAEACFEESEHIFLDLAREDERAHTLREWAMYEQKRGNQQRGRHLWAEARAIFARLGAQHEVDRMDEIYTQETESSEARPGSASAGGDKGTGRPGR